VKRDESEARKASQKPEARSQKKRRSHKAKARSQKKSQRPMGGFVFGLDLSSGFWLLASDFAFSSGFWLLASGLFYSLPRRNP
jgi:hypothetical protein